MPLNYDEVADLIRIIDGSGCDELILETAELKLVLRRGRAGAQPEPAAQLEHRAPSTVPSPRPAQPAAGADAPAAPGDGKAGEGETVVRAPMVGTFYRSPSPEAASFVEAGSVVEAGQPLCLIEVMKLFTTIYAETSGRVARIIPENGSLVEYGQALFVLKAD